MFKVYDLKNRKKIVATGSQKECASVIGCDYTYISKAAAKGTKIFGRYLVMKTK